MIFRNKRGDIFFSKKPVKECRNFFLPQKPHLGRFKTVVKTE
jgi:hypothetical protein